MTLAAKAFAAAPFAAAAQVGDLLLAHTHTVFSLVGQAAAEGLQEGRERLQRIAEQGPAAVQPWTAASQDVSRWGERARDLSQSLWDAQLTTARSIGAVLQGGAEGAARSIGAVLQGGAEGAAKAAKAR